MLDPFPPPPSRDGEQAKRHIKILILSLYGSVSICQLMKATGCRECLGWYVCECTLQLIRGAYITSHLIKKEANAGGIPALLIEIM